MKLYKSLLMFAVAAVAFCSCSDEGYWEPYEIEETQYSFAQAKQSYSLTATDSLSSVTVTVYRNTKGAAVTLPLNVEISDPYVLSVADSSVTFAAGSNIAEFELLVDESYIAMGTTYSAKFSFVVDTVNFTENNYSVSGNKSHQVSIVKDYTWVSAGKVTMTSNWAGAQAVVPVENAKEYDVNGNKLYRLNSPYYYLEPSYCPKPGAHLQFILDADANAVTIAPSIQSIGEAASSGGVWNFYFVTTGGYAQYCAFMNQGNVYAMYGLWISGDASIGYSVQYTAAEQFEWTEGWPGATE